MNIWIIWNFSDIVLLIYVYSLVCLSINNYTQREKLILISSTEFIISPYIPSKLTIIVKHVQAICVGKTLFSGKKSIRFFGIFLCKLNFDFLHDNENKNGDISDEKSQKSKEKKGFSTTLKNKKTNFWLVWRQERPGIISTKWIMKFLSSKYDGTQMYIS